MVNQIKRASVALLLIAAGSSSAFCQGSSQVTGTPCGSAAQGAGVGGIGARADGPCSDSPSDVQNRSTGDAFTRSSQEFVRERKVPSR